MKTMQNDQRGVYKILGIMLIVAAIFAVVGFLVVRQRIKMPSKSAEQQNSNTDHANTQPDVPAVDTVIPSDWKLYTNDKHGFSLRYPTNLKAGSVSTNSVLGTFQVPVRGLHVGPMVLIALEDADLKKQAQDYFNGFYNSALHSTKETAGDGPGPIVCKVDRNDANFKAVSCSGEGGPAKYAYLTGQSYDVFVDGYSQGYDDQDNGHFIAASDFINILQTFKFTKDTVSQNPTPTPTPNPNPTPSPTASQSPNPTPAPTATAAIQNFSINADDTQADLSELTVPAGTIVEITFNVASSNVYYGGLDFRSSVINSGTVHSGESKTISFVAKQSFAFTPYWPASNVAKGYKINVMVQ